MDPVSGLPSALAPVPASLWAGALSELLNHGETGCRQSARRAADLLTRLADSPAVDREVRDLCERACERLAHPEQERRHVPGL